MIRIKSFYFLLLAITAVTQSCISSDKVYYEYEYAITYTKKNYISYTEEKIIEKTHSAFMGKDTLFFLHAQDTANFLIQGTLDTITQEVVQWDTLFDIIPEKANGPYLLNREKGIIEYSDRNHQKRTLKWFDYKDTVDYYSIETCNLLKENSLCRVFYSGKEGICIVNNKEYKCDIFIAFCPQRGLHGKNTFSFIFLDKKTKMILRKDFYVMEDLSLRFHNMNEGIFVPDISNYTGSTYVTNIKKSALTPSKVKYWDECYP